jgi:hypothetical protein
MTRIAASTDCEATDRVCPANQACADPAGAELSRRTSWRL